MTSLFSRPALKSAETGGNDTSFEESFSALAHAVVRDKASNLSQHELGFQVVMTNEDKTRALGVLGFKLGNTLAYIPVFFNNGDIKGTEFLYLKAQDMVVPSSEEYVNYLLNSSPDVLGYGVNRSARNESQSNPNYWQIKYPPSKVAAALGVHVAGWAVPFLKFLGQIALLEKQASSRADKTLLDFLKEAGAAVGDAFVRWMAARPRLMEAVDRFHGRDKVAEALREGRRRASLGSSVVGRAVRKSVVNPPIKSAGVCVIHIGRLLGAESSILGAPEEVLEVGQAEREKVLQGKVVIRDDRTDSEVTEVYETDPGQTLFNPGAAGLYEVLVAPGEFATCFVSEGPAGGGAKRKPFVTVVRLSDRSWVNVHPSMVWASQEKPRDEFDTWFGGLSDQDNVTDGLCLLVGPRGTATLPLEVERVHGGQFRTFDVCFHESAERYRPDAANRNFKGYDRFDRDYVAREPLLRARKLVLTGKPGVALRPAGDALYVPSDFKVLKLSISGKAPALVLGNLMEFEIGLRKAAGVEVVLESDGRTWTVDGGTKMARDETLVELVERRGLRALVAAELMDRAVRDRTTRARFKYAAQYHEDGPDAPPIPEGWVGPDSIAGALPEQYGQQLAVPVTDARSSPDAPERYRVTDSYHPYAVGNGEMTFGNDGNEAAGGAEEDELAELAARSGNKELFDTAAIAGIVRTTRVDRLIGSEYLSRAAEYGDQTARLLMNAYWNDEAWKERFGDTDYQDLCDMLLELFEQNGKVYLRLKEQQPDAGLDRGVLPSFLNNDEQ